VWYGEGSRRCFYVEGIPIPIEADCSLPSRFRLLPAATTASKYGTSNLCMQPFFCLIVYRSRGFWLNREMRRWYCGDRAR
jgi:hypothetical protein